MFRNLKIYFCIYVFTACLGFYEKKNSLSLKKILIPSENQYWNIIVRNIIILKPFLVILL